MPKLSAAAMVARREEILAAARRCFARRGFSATTIGDIRAESGLSTGGIYTHFKDKHAIVAALSSSLTQEGPGVQSRRDLLKAYANLQTAKGGERAKVDLQLWAAALGEEQLSELVEQSLSRTHEQLRNLVAGEDPSAKAQLLEALVLGLSVQRALGRSPAKGKKRALKFLLRTLLGEARK